MNRIAKICAALVFAGAALIVFGVTIPVYQDLAAARALIENACRGGSVAADWFEKMDSLRTWRYPLMQGGGSLVLAAMTLLALFGARAGRGEDWAVTPSSRIAFFALGINAIVWIFVSEVVSFGLDQSRNYLPYCADSVGIPIYGMMIGFPFVVGICILGGWLISILFGQLPAGLMIWDHDRQVRSAIASAIFGAVFVSTAGIALSVAVESNFIATPGWIVILFLVASARAGVIAPKTG